MSLFGLLEVPLIIFMVIVAPIWLVLHYRSKGNAAKSMTPEDEKLLADLWQSARLMEDRLQTLERILDADAPDWREKRR
ncbi:MAG: envelope stress response membrane protein PspB [Lysobacterales bacterium]